MEDLDPIAVRKLAASILGKAGGACKVRVHSASARARFGSEMANKRWAKYRAKQLAARIEGGGQVERQVDRLGDRLNQTTKPNETTTR